MYAFGAMILQYLEIIIISYIDGLPDINLRFTPADEVDIDPSIIPDVVTSNILPKYSSGYPLPSPKTIEHVYTYRDQKDLNHLTPWYHNYQHLSCKFLGASEHETLNHPVACIIAVSTADSDPVTLAKTLAVESNLPKIFKRGFMDPNMLKIYLLVHSALDSLQLE